MTRIPVDNYIGCLLGGAIGDALGAPIEFMDIAEIRAKFGSHGITDFVEFPGNVGEFTDDTQMTLFTAEGLLRAEHRANIKGIRGAINYISHHSYLRWLHTQNFEVNLDNIKNGVYDVENGWLIKQKGLFKRRSPGNTCISSLISGNAGSINSPINDSKGCGTIMRMAPVGLMYCGNNEHSFKTACDFSAITHGHPTGYLSAGFFASVISDLAVGVDLKRSIDNAIAILKGWNQHHETLIAVENAVELYTKTTSHECELKAETIEKLGKGWTAEEALSISIFISLLFQDDFMNGILASVNHSGDSDSTGSVTGNILGLINGLKSIPAKWVKKLRYNNIVIQIAKDLYTGVKGDIIGIDDEWWEKYPGY